jgi:hypothetical protein
MGGFLGRAIGFRTWLLLLALAVGVLFLGFSLAATEGHFTAPIVDLYVIAQYARAMAEGHPFQYNPGDAPSTGATSLLHTAVLAVAHAAGAQGEGLIAFATLFGMLLYGASVLRAERIGRLLGEQRDGRLAAITVALGGPAVWGFLYGSDSALFAFLALWLFERLLREWERPLPWGIAASGVLLALARPEGLPIALLLGAGLAWNERRRGFRSQLVVWLPAFCGFGVLAFQRWLTGFWLGTSVADKSLLANYGLADSLALVAEYLQDVLRGLLLGLYPSQTPVGFARGWAPYFLPPLGLLLLLLAAAKPPAHLRTPLRAWLLIITAVFLLVAPNVFMGVHFNRYLLWAFPSLQVLVAVGLGVAARQLIASPELGRSVYRGGAALMVIFGLISTVRFGLLYGEMAGSVHRRDVAAARWIASHLPQGVAMANLATSVEYLTGHRNLNLHGVTSPAFFGNRKAEREAGVFESLGRLPEAERPPYLITSASSQESYPSMRELVTGPPLFQSTSFSDEILIFRTRYTLLDRNRHLFSQEALSASAGLDEVDRLNVCDARDEAAHDYVFRSQIGGLQLHGTARIEAYPPGELGASERVIDGGRAILGYESFRVRARPGRDLVMVTRTAASMDANVLRASGSSRFGIEFPEAGMIVSVDGQPATRLTFVPRPGWDEQTLRIPGRLVTRESSELRIAGRYASFYYWFFQ